MSLVEFAQLTWPETEVLGDDAVGLIHLGSLEQHGPHLPLITDAALGSELAHRVSKRLRPPIVVMPTVPFGLSDHHLGFPGTVSVGAGVLQAVIEAFVRGLATAGVRRVAIFSAHGGNFGLLRELDARAASGGVEVACYFDFEAFVATMETAGRSAGLDPPVTDVHAGVLETSAVLSIMPESVRPFSGLSGYVAAEPGWLEKLWGEGTLSLHENGVLGDPRGSTAHAGGAIVEALADLLATWVAERFELELA